MNKTIEHLEKEKHKIDCQRFWELLEWSKKRCFENINAFIDDQIRRALTENNLTVDQIELFESPSFDGKKIQYVIMHENKVIRKFRVEYEKN